MSKQILFSDEGRMKMFSGMEKLNDAVSTTLGPKGRNVIFSKSYGAPQVTNDGVTIAKEIELEDSVENMGVELIKDAASKTNDAAGDGTTTATVLTYAMIKEGLREIRSGINAIALKNGMKRAVDVVNTELAKNSKHINTMEEIASVATISSQNPEAGQIIAAAMEKVKQDGVITVEEGKTFGLEVDVTEGMKLESGYISPYMITDGEKMEARFSDVPVLITDKKISTMKDILPVLEGLAQSGKRDVVIIAEDLDGEALTGIVLNKLKGVLNVLGIKAPGFGDRKKEILKDIAIITGATMIEDEVGLNFENMDMSHLGKIESITASKDSTIIVGGNGEKNAIENRIEEIRNQIDAASSDYDKEKLAERLAKLAGGVAVIKVGAASEVEMKEMKLRIEDALNSTRAAVAEGVVAGGGVALLKASKALDEFASENHDEIIGAKIVQRALQYPAKKISENAGKESALVLKEILDNSDVNYGYDAEKDVFTDMVSAGIIDPKKVSRTALENAVSIAGMFLTSEAMICDLPKKESDHDHEVPATGMGGMGWMWGMGGMM